MLIGMEQEKGNIRTEMSQAAFNFYLTGSRFFGNSRPDSDWDFFAESTPEIRIWLKEHGFKKLPFYGCISDNFLISDTGDPCTGLILGEFTWVYSDNNIAEVWEHKDGVHIQLQKDINAKIRAQALIKALYLYLRPINKKQWKYIWNAAYSILR